MSSLLWRAYYDNDVDTFRQLLEASTISARPGAARGGSATAVIGSPGGLGTSPTISARARKAQSLPGQGAPLTKTEINFRDANGLTLLHHAASSTIATSLGFASALIEHPLLDLYVQDYENGWTALHRAFYFGNVTIARLIMERDVGDSLGHTTGHVQQTIGLIKVKDREGHGPLDLFAATIRDRTLRPERANRTRSSSNESDDGWARHESDDDGQADTRIAYSVVGGDEVFTFGSNKNVSLGFGDEDDRQYPERITLRRPEHLLRRFYKEHLRSVAKKWASHDPTFVSQTSTATNVPLEEIPWRIRSRPLVVQNVHMAKFHTAVLTTDPESNLYMCGHGQGGRLGVGDERTRFHFVCVDVGALAGKKIAAVALGQNHSVALSDEGEIFSWGNNGYGQLGYSLPRSSFSNEDPVSVVPRQIFGPLKRETVTGIAASRIHSVAFTSSSLYTFGKNQGQLGIVDSDARSLDMQVTPRKVAASLFSSPIALTSAIDTATICLLDNHDVWVFANYGYAKVQFPLDGFSNYFLQQSFLVTTYDSVQNHIVKIASAGDSICALSSRGEVYTASISQHADNQASASTTNPSKIRGAITTPYKIWSPKKSSMDARDVEIDADGSIILSTEEGSVWKRNKRGKLKNATAIGTGEYKPKDYKFSRVPGLTRVLGVRASAHGAYAAIKRDCDVTRTQVVVEDPSLWSNLFPLLSLKHLAKTDNGIGEEDDRPRFWQASTKPDAVMLVKQAILSSKDIEIELKGIADRCFNDGQARYDALLATSTSDVQIPVHRFILSGRSKVLRRGFRDLCGTSTFTIPDFAVSEIDGSGKTIVRFQALDVLTLVDLALYLYTDQIIDFWQLTRNAPKMAYRYRLIRTELMKVASKLELIKLEPAVRQMSSPTPCLDMDMELALQDPVYFFDGDIAIQLEDEELRVHGALVCARCPFFEGLFMGRAGGRWVAGRENYDAVSVDLTHLPARTFKMVLRHIYADTGAALFDDVVSPDLDSFLDTVLDVLSAANELMLDRLSQICQAVLGEFVNVRNASWLLNAISPSSVHEFKDAGLEYLCLSVEAMLQGHHLNDLDQDLQLELDEVVQQNQLACMPFAKSGRAELLLHERHPELAAVIERNRQSKVDAISVRSKFHQKEAFMPGSADDAATAIAAQQKARRRTPATRIETPHPPLKSKASSKDIFAMDEDDERQAYQAKESPTLRLPASTNLPTTGELGSTPAVEVWYDAKGKAIASSSPTVQNPTSLGLTPKTPRSPEIQARTPPSSASPWNLAPLPGMSVDMKDIMAQASSSRISSLSQALATMNPTQTPSAAEPATKLSQKDRKRMQQAHQGESGLNKEPSPVVELPKIGVGKQASPWQTITAQKVPSLKDVIDKQQKGPGSPPTMAPLAAKPPTSRAASTPQLTMRQTVANPKPTFSPKPVTGPAGQSSIHQRAPSETKMSPQSIPGRPKAQHAASQPTSQAAVPSSSVGSGPTPHSIRHQPRPVEPALQLSMSDILAQQQAEKDVVREAVAKRDLQDIQAEQEFQEWWDKESARVQEAEAAQQQQQARKNAASRKPRNRGGGNIGRSGGRGGNRVQARRGGGGAAPDGSNEPNAASNT